MPKDMAWNLNPLPPVLSAPSLEGSNDIYETIAFVSASKRGNPSVKAQREVPGREYERRLRQSFCVCFQDYTAKISTLKQTNKQRKNATF